MKQVGIGIGAVLTLLVAGACGAATTDNPDKSAPSAAPPSAQNGARVAHFDGYGPIKIGMTEAEVLKVTNQKLDKQHYYNCTVLAAAPGADSRSLSVWIDDDTRKVTGIITPQDTMTDRGVGDGSTAAAVTDAYAEGATVERTGGGQGAEVLKVAPINAEPGQSLAFLLDGETVGQPYVGRSPGDEGCTLG